MRKELRIKYKNSVLGFLWSLANPALYLGVFYVVFEIVLDVGIPDFPVFFLAGLLPWNLFATALGGATQSIVVNTSLVNKVWFPREILPVAAVGASVVNFLLQAAVLLVALLAFGHAPSWGHLPVVLVALVVLIVLATAIGVALSAANVYLRDVQHLLELVLLAWFWVTPIVYQYRLPADRLGESAWLLLLNPMTPIVLAFQRGLYNRTGGADAGGRLGEAAQSTGILPDESILWYLGNVAALGIVAVGLLLGALWIFGRLEDDFAEEL